MVVRRGAQRRRARSFLYARASTVAVGMSIPYRRAQLSHRILRRSSSFRGKPRNSSTAVGNEPSQCG